MKWFKHDTSAHKGSILQELYATFGVNEGYALYFRLIEYLGHKWDGISEPRFKILTSELRQYLKLTTRRLHQYAAIMELSDNSAFKVTEQFCDIYLPKLLEIRHRDALQAGLRPEISQQKNGREKNRKEKSIFTPTEDQLRWYKELSNLFTNTFSNTTIGAKAEQRFLEQVKTNADAEDLRKSISNYKAAIDCDNRDREWRKSKRSFETYLGTRSSGFYWRQYINPPNVGPKLKVLEL